MSESTTRALAITLSIGATMCAGEHLGTTQQELTSSDPLWFVNAGLEPIPPDYPPPPPTMVTFPEASETSIVRVVMPNFTEHLVMGFNDRDLGLTRANPITTADPLHLDSYMGWAWADLSQPFAWTYCNAFATSSYPPQGKGCGLNGGPMPLPVPMAPGQNKWLSECVGGSAARWIEHSDLVKRRAA